MKIIFSLLAAFFSFCIYWAAAQKPISESGAWLLSDPWGIVTLIDLYIGFFLFSIFMFITVRKKISLLIWVPLLMTLGNIVSLIYLLIYFKEPKKTLKAKNENN